MELSGNLRNQIEQIASITSGVQKAYYDSILANCKEINCVSIYDVFNEDELNDIFTYLRPQKKECFRNATKLCELFPDKVLYCEGKLDVYGLGIDHAWNKVGDKYVDITAELALEDSLEEIKNNEYLLFGEYDFITINKVMFKTQFFGDIYQTLFQESYKEKSGH